MRKALKVILAFLAIAVTALILAGQYLIAGWVIGGALLLGCGMILIKGKNSLGRSSDDDIITHPSYSDLSCNVWHKENGD